MYMYVHVCTCTLYLINSYMYTYYTICTCTCTCIIIIIMYSMCCWCYLLYALLFIFQIPKSFLSPRQKISSEEMHTSNEIAIRVIHRQRGTDSVWSLNTLAEKVLTMRDMYQRLEEGGMGPLLVRHSNTVTQIGREWSLKYTSLFVLPHKDGYVHVHVTCTCILYDYTTYMYMQ